MSEARNLFRLYVAQKQSDSPESYLDFCEFVLRQERERIRKTAEAMPHATYSSYYFQKEAFLQLLDKILAEEKKET